MRIALGRPLALITTLALVATSWAGVSHAATVTADPTIDPCAPTALAEPAECAPTTRQAPSVDRAPGQDLVPILPGAAFADGLGGGSFYDKVTHPPGNNTDPAVMAVEGAGNSIYGYDFSPDGSVLYGVDNTDSTLVTVDQSSGAATPVGPMSRPAGHTWTDVTIDPLTGAAYAMSSDGMVTTVFSLDLSTGAVGVIGDAPVGNAIDASMNCAGEMYATSIVTDSLYSVDPATGTFTMIGPLGYNASFAQGMDFDNATGILHAWLYQGSGVNQYSSVDLATGTATAFPAGGPAGEFEGAIKTTCTAPSAAIVAGPSSRTPNVRPDFGFNASGGTVQCSLDRGTPQWGGCTTAASFQPTTNLAPGAWTFRVRSTQRSLTAQDTRSFTVVDCRALAVAVEKAKAKVAKAKSALQKAKQTGKASAITKAKAKLKKAKKKLRKARKALAAETVC